jgi:hypothetical protein
MKIKFSCNQTIKMTEMSKLMIFIWHFEWEINNLDELNA